MTNPTGTTTQDPWDGVRATLLKSPLGTDSPLMNIELEKTLAELKLQFDVIWKAA